VFSLTAYLDGMYQRDLVAGTHTLLAQDAVIAVYLEKGVAVVNGTRSGLGPNGYLRYI
jgi:hypothetical protein